jgi:hypothetical protein
LRPAQAKSKTLSQKYSTQKRADGVAWVVGYLPSKCETLNSKPQYHPPKKKKEKEIE